MDVKMKNRLMLISFTLCSSYANAMEEHSFDYNYFVPNFITPRHGNVLPNIRDIFPEHFMPLNPPQPMMPAPPQEERAPTPASQEIAEISEDQAALDMKTLNGNFFKHINPLMYQKQFANLPLENIDAFSEFDHEKSAFKISNLIQSYDDALKIKDLKTKKDEIEKLINTIDIRKHYVLKKNLFLKFRYVHTCYMLYDLEKGRGKNDWKKIIENIEFSMSPEKLNNSKNQPSIHDYLSISLVLYNWSILAAQYGPNLINSERFLNLALSTLSIVPDNEKTDQIFEKIKRIHEACNKIGFNPPPAQINYLFKNEHLANKTNVFNNPPLANKKILFIDYAAKKQKFK